MNRTTILIVDDDQQVRKALRRLLERGSGFRVLEAGGRDTALQLLAAEPVDAVLLDMYLGEVMGKEVYHSLVAAHPHLKGRVIIISGEPVSNHPWVQAHGLPSLEKPFDTVQLLRLLQWMLAQPREANG